MKFLKSSLFVLILAQQVYSQSESLIRLKPGKRVEAELLAVKPHRYSVRLRAGQYMSIQVERPTGALVVRLSTGTVLLQELHWPSAPLVLEPLSWIAKKSGVYRIELAAAVPNEAAGKYAITLEKIRRTVANDQKQLELQHQFEAARLLDAKREYAQAVTIWNQALAETRALGHREREAAALNALGSTHENLSQFEKAFGYFEQAMEVHRGVKDRLGEGHALRNMGNMARNLGQVQKATDYQERALKVAREVRDRNGEARALANLAIAASNSGQSEKAIDLYQQALAILHEVKDRSTEGRLLANLGTTYYTVGRYESAIGYFEQAITIAKAVNDRRGEGRVLGNLGSAYYNMSHYEKAISYYNQALAIRREVRDRRDEANALAILGSAYRSLGQYEKSINHYEQAVAVFRDLKVRRDEGNALMNLGITYSGSNRQEQAIPFFEQSLGIAREVKDPRGEGSALNFLGSSFFDLGQTGKATTYFEQALTLRRQGKDRSGEGITLGNLGRVYGRLGQQEKSISYFEQAVAIGREIKSRQIEIANLTRLMDAWKFNGQNSVAVFYGKQAVNAIQSIRADIRGLTQDLQTSYLKGNESPYHKLADLLIAQGRLSEAEQVLGLLKEQEFFEFVRRDSLEAASAKGGADLTPEESTLAKSYSEIGGRLVALGSERGELVGKKTLSPEETARLTKIEADLTIGSRAFEKFLGDLSTQFSAKPDAAAKLVQLRDSQGFMSDLSELPPGTVAIYTLVGEDKYRAILVTPEVQKAFEYPIKGAELNKKILEFREVIRNPRLDPRPRAQELYKILVGIMAPDLQQAKAKTLMFSLDGTLRYLPLAALYDGEHYFVEQYKLAVFTPASNARMKDRPTAQWRAAGFGVTKAFEGAPALPSVASEMNGIILSNPGSEGVMQGELRLDGAFTQETMKSTLRKSFPVVHIASHFMFQPGNDASSFLLLGDGSHFSLAELNSTRNLFANVQLLTLSACNTGVGDVPGEGKEVEGFGVMAQRQGAKAVIASLWPVADSSTSLLMREFYRIRESEPGMTKAEALGRAQLALLHGTAKRRAGGESERALIHEEPTSKTAPIQAPSFKATEGIPFAHPYFWAPFFLMGNWL